MQGVVGEDELEVFAVSRDKAKLDAFEREAGGVKNVEMRLDNASMTEAQRIQAHF